MSHSEAIAVMLRELGRQLAGLRQGAALTQQDLAAQTGFSRTTVSLAEIGRQPPAREFWAACDTVLGTGGVLTTGFDQIEAARKAGHRAVARAAQEAREAQALAEFEAAQRTSGAAARVTGVQGCPHCGHPLIVITTLVPRDASPSATP